MGARDDFGQSPVHAGRTIFRTQTHSGRSWNALTIDQATRTAAMHFAFLSPPWEDVMQ
jgi:hypothetical protein